jgi:hypothetical protein
MRLNARIDVGEGADRARDGAGRDVGARGFEADAVAGELGVRLGELETEGDRLSMDAVTAADGRGHLVLERAALEHREQLVEVGEEDVGGLGQLDRQAGVEHIGTRHALVEPARLGAHLLTGPSEEGDDVVLRDRLNLVDRGHVDLAKHIGIVGGADSPRVRGRDRPDLAHRLGGKHLDREPDAIAVFG